MPLYKLRAIQVELKDASDLKITKDDFRTNLGAIVFGRPYAGEPGSCPIDINSKEYDFLLDYVSRHDFTVDYAGEEPDGPHLKSGYCRHMERLRNTLSENLMPHLYKAAEDERIKYMADKIGFPTYIANVRAIIYGTAWSGHRGCVEYNAMSREEVELLLDYIRHQMGLHR